MANTEMKISKVKRLLQPFPVRLTSSAVVCFHAFAETATAHSNAQSQLKLEARLPMTENSGPYLVPVGIDGKDYSMIVGTGPARTAFTSAAADMLRAGSIKDPPSVLRGSQSARFLPSLRLGPSEWSISTC
ncbi:hypothetical protein [Paraburkholderia sp. DGU8]|uniref:hypothetical protein n=1 Tax=Paraburkholderia sp. DGU8 TaxID=3161997 RepID=UPI003464F685